MTRITTAALAALLVLIYALALAGCGEENGAEIVGEWTPSTVSIGGATIPYSELQTEGRDFSFRFYPDGRCKIVIGGVSNEGSYTFNKTSVDIEYGGKSQKLAYDKGILTLSLNYNNEVTSYMFTKTVANDSKE